MDNSLKLIIKIFGSLIFGIVLMAVTINVISAHYQSQITGYTFGQCFWAGESVKNIVLKK